MTSLLKKNIEPESIDSIMKNFKGNGSGGVKKACGRPKMSCKRKDNSILRI